MLREKRLLKHQLLAWKAPPTNFPVKQKIIKKQTFRASRNGFKANEKSLNDQENLDIQEKSKKIH